MNECYSIFRKILERYKTNEISKKEINTILTNEVDIEYVHNSNNTLESD